MQVKNLRKNPYAEKIKKQGYRVIINYSPEDVAMMDKDFPLDLTRLEREALQCYYENNVVALEQSS